jgi:hypothetical protein
MGRELFLRCELGLARPLQSPCKCAPERLRQSFSSPPARPHRQPRGPSLRDPLHSLLSPLLQPIPHRSAMDSSLSSTVPSDSPLANIPPAVIQALMGQMNASKDSTYGAAFVGLAASSACALSSSSSCCRAPAAHSRPGCSVSCVRRCTPTSGGIPSTGRSTKSW